jgi:hypothetical protein
MFTVEALDGGIALEVDGLVVAAPRTTAIKREMMLEATGDQCDGPFRLEVQGAAAGDLLMEAFRTEARQDPVRPGCMVEEPRAVTSRELLL